MNTQFLRTAIKYGLGFYLLVVAQPSYGAIKCANIFSGGAVARNEQEDFDFLSSNGYSDGVALRIASAYPEIVAKMRGSRKFRKPTVGWRGFEGSFEKYDPNFDYTRMNGEVWFATQLSDPTFYVYLSQIEELQQQYTDERFAAKFEPSGYILEYEIPSIVTFTQDGEFGKPVVGPPKPGKSPYDRAGNGTWGFFKRDEIPNQTPIIRNVLLPKSAKISTQPVRIRGSGVQNVDVITAEYYVVPFEYAFKNGKPIRKIPRGTPVVKVTHYKADPD